MPALFICVLYGCATSSQFDLPSTAIQNISQQNYNTQDYIDHQVALKGSLLTELEGKVVDLNWSQKNYLESLFNNIRDNNELFFLKKNKPVFYFVKSKEPFHFSLPENIYFFSTGLMDKYVKNESLLKCILVFEMIRSEKNIYRKNTLYPTGSLAIEKFLRIQRIDPEEKVQIHKWAYYILRRVDTHGDTYLSWLQVKNRNSLDFVKQLGDVQSISREESMFKSFLIKSTQKYRRIIEYKGSSRSFYRFISYLKGQA